MVKTINDWMPETLSLLNLLLAAGFEIKKTSNGEDEKKFSSVETAAKHLEETDEGFLRVVNPNGAAKIIYLVYGNSPGELVSDYTVDEGLDHITSLHYEKWIGKEQPKKEIS